MGRVKTGPLNFNDLNMVNRFSTGNEVLNAKA